MHWLFNCINLFIDIYIYIFAENFYTLGTEWIMDQFIKIMEYDNSMKIRSKVKLNNILLRILFPIYHLFNIRKIVNIQNNHFI